MNLFVGSDYLSTGVCKLRPGESYMVDVAQLVRASDCDSEGRGFEPHHSPQKVKRLSKGGLFAFKASCTPKINVVKRGSIFYELFTALKKARTD
jgi:hypothetical protein